MDKKSPSETDIRTKHITPAISQAELEVPPLIDIDAPIEIVRVFGGKAGFDHAMQELEQASYATNLH